MDTIILHATGGESYEGAISWLCNPKSGVSAHYVIGRAGEIAKLVPTSMCAWHAGKAKHPADGRCNVNLRSIGIELVNRNYGGQKYPPAQIAALDWLLQQLIAAIPTLRFCFSHRAVAIPKGRKTDPWGLDVPSIAARHRLEG